VGGGCPSRPIAGAWMPDGPGSGGPDTATMVAMILCCETGTGALAGTHELARTLLFHGPSRHGRRGR
jgi:hypothetical protein